jgi:hypothetical protein
MGEAATVAKENGGNYIAEWQEHAAAAVLSLPALGHLPSSPQHPLGHLVVHLLN